MDASEDTYTGDVVIGGPSAVRTLAGLEIRKASVGEMDNNAYLLTCRRTGARLLVDAAADADRLIALIGEPERGAGLTTVVTTHRHADHHGALAEVVAATGAVVATGADDADHLPVPVAARLVHGDTVMVGDVLLEVVGLRGHTPGSIALVYREPVADGAGTSGHAGAGGRAHLFSGDSLFPGGPGATGRDPERFGQLFADLTERVFAVHADDTWVYPGHGADTTLGAERPHLEEWRSRGW